MLIKDTAYLAIIGNVQDRKLKIVQCAFHSMVHRQRMELLRFTTIELCPKTHRNFTRYLHFHEDAQYEPILSSSTMLTEPEALCSSYLIHNKIYVSLVAANEPSSVLEQRISHMEILLEQGRMPTSKTKIESASKWHQTHSLNNNAN